MKNTNLKTKICVWKIKVHYGIDQYSPIPLATKKIYALNYF